MKKATIWFCLLLITVFVGDRVVGAFLTHLTKDSQFRYTQLYNGAAAADILFVGNSRGLSFYQPRVEAITGKKTANLSYNGLPINLAKNLIADYLERYPNKPTIVLDITMLDRDNKELIAGFVCYARASPRLDTLIHGQSDDVFWGAKISDLFAHNSEVYQRSAYYRNKTDKDWIVDRQILATTAATTPLDTFYIKVKEKWVQQLAETVRIAQQAGAPIELVIGPFYPGMVRDWRNLTDLRTAVEKRTGLTVKDYSQALTDPSCFGDLIHLNKKGAIEFMDLLKRDSIF
jgi:hypothetical protein